MSVESVMPLAGLIGGDRRFRAFPRHWLNIFQYRPDLGILSNNIVSDNAIFCMFTFTDPAVYTPPLPAGIEAIQLARESLDRYFAGAPGYGVGTEVFMDTDPAVLAAAWDVIRVSGDMATLKRWLPHLEKYAAHMKSQDRDGNGLSESSRSGRRRDTAPPTSNWWDCINFGHEDAYGLRAGLPRPPRAGRPGAPGGPRGAGGRLRSRRRENPRRLPAELL